MKVVNHSTTDPNEIGIESVKIIYHQEPDTNSNSDEWQFLEISTDTADGTEFYFNLKTDRWSINDVDELITVLEDFKRRVNLTTND